MTARHRLPCNRVFNVKLYDSILLEAARQDRAAVSNSKISYTAPTPVQSWFGNFQQYPSIG